jgi:hypothetical protein
MSDLISELWKRIIQITQIENRLSFCSEFVPCFELDGGIYPIDMEPLQQSNHIVWR